MNPKRSVFRCGGRLVQREGTRASRQASVAGSLKRDAAATSKRIPIDSPLSIVTGE